MTSLVLTFDQGTCHRKLGAACVAHAPPVHSPPLHTSRVAQPQPLQQAVNTTKHLINSSLKLFKMALLNSSSTLILLLSITTIRSTKFRYCSATFPVEGMTSLIRSLVETTYNSAKLAENHPELQHGKDWIMIPDHCRPVRYGLLCDPMRGPSCTNPDTDFFICDDGVPFNCNQRCDDLNDCRDGYDQHISVCAGIYVQKSPWPNQLCQDYNIGFNFTAPRDRLGD